VAALAPIARLSGTGSPSHDPVAQVFNLCDFPILIGIGCDSG
jgi:hypothetical protein